MDLHLHLSVAFRALDRKWGTPVDLDTTEYTKDSLPCLPAVVDLQTTTFSLEDYLKVKRFWSTPYSRNERKRRKEHIKKVDSFSDISSSKLPSLTDLESITSCEEYFEGHSDKCSIDSVETLKLIDECKVETDKTFSTDDVIGSVNIFSESIGVSTGSTYSVDSGIGRNRYNIWKQLKENVTTTLKIKPKVNGQEPKKRVKLFS